MIYVLSGGQTGATLTVTSSDAGTITVSNTTLKKSYSKPVTAGGSAVFKGLQTGTWTIKLTDGSKTSTKNITITSDYSTSIAYFSATISITYPAKSTCVVKNSSGTTITSNTNTGSSAKTWTATVNATGTYTVTATATDGSGKSKSQSVSITANGQSKSVTLNYAVYIFANGAGDYAGAYQDIVSTSLVNNKIHAIADGAFGNCFVFANAVDVSGFKTIKVKMVQQSYSTYKTNIGILKSKPNATGDIGNQIINKVVVAAEITDTSGTEKVFEADISSVQTGSYYIGGIALATFDISEIWLE